MRMMPLMGDVLQKHGFSVIFVPGGEIMPNLNRGVLDAAEYSIPGFDKTLGIWEICKYVMLPGIHQPASQLELLVNKDAYAALPDDLKKALEAAVAKSRVDEWLWMEKKNIEAVEFLKKNGIEFVTMDPETVSTLVKWAGEYLDERSAKDSTFAKFTTIVIDFDDAVQHQHIVDWEFGVARSEKLGAGRDAPGAKPHGCEPGASPIVSQTNPQMRLHQWQKEKKNLPI